MFEPIIDPSGFTNSSISPFDLLLDFDFEDKSLWIYCFDNFFPEFNIFDIIF